MKIEVKLSRRFAERLLNESDCVVYVEGFDYLGKPIKNMRLETKQGTIYYDGGKSFIKTHEGVDIELTAIKKIRHIGHVLEEEVAW